MVNTVLLCSAANILLLSGSATLLQVMMLSFGGRNMVN
jgi:hypothetical protein